MSARMVPAGARGLLAASSPMRSSTIRSFSSTSAKLAEPVIALPARKPVGAFRGGLFGFLLGSTLAGAGVYSYVLQEYKASNELLTEDIYALQASCQRLSKYVQTLEEKMDTVERKRK